MLTNLAVTKLLVVATLAFALAFMFTPVVMRFLFKHKFGKRLRDVKEAPIFHRLHAKKLGLPTMGGLVVWIPVLALALGLHALSIWLPETWGVTRIFARVDFLSRSQTWLPLGALVASALVGVVDDYLNVRGIGAHGGGLRARHRLAIYTAIAFVGAWWFTFKLEWQILHVPFLGDLSVGFWSLFIFAVIIVATSFSTNQTDGLDGLAGGVLLTSFGAYGVIALIIGREDLAALCAAIVGALLAFLWFNIPPARFMMGDTGSMSLGVTLGIIAMLTNQPLLLPVIGFVFVVEMLSSIIQMASKKLRDKKIFLSSPLHHHLEAIGWPEPKIVMRAWIVSMVMAALGVALAVLDVNLGVGLL